MTTKLATGASNDEDEYQTAGSQAALMSTDTSAIYVYNETDDTNLVTTGDMAAGDVLVASATIATNEWMSMAEERSWRAREIMYRMFIQVHPLPLQLRGPTF